MNASDFLPAQFNAAAWFVDKNVAEGRGVELRGQEVRRVHVWLPRWLRLAPHLSPGGRLAPRGGARTHGHRLDLDPELGANEPADDQQRVRGVRPVRKVRGEHLVPCLHEALDVVRADEEGLEADDVLHRAAGGLHDAADVREGLLRLRLDVRAGQLARPPGADLPATT